MTEGPTTKPVKRVVRAGLSEQVYQALKVDIMNDKFEAGERIIIDELVREMGVSATPIREALVRLSAEQLVSVERYVGYAILPKPSADEIAQLFVAREAIEVCAGRIAAERISEEEIVYMESVHDRITSRTYGAERYADFVPFIIDNQEFHEILVGASGNAPLATAFRSLNYDNLIARASRGRGVPDLGHIAEEHQAIIAALKSHDPKTAEVAIRQHICEGSKRMVSDVIAPRS